MISPSPSASRSRLAIHTRGLRKVFGEKVAVKNLTLEVPQGEVFGFLGPNGAGKSTSVKMLLGLVSPTAGAATVLGRPAGNVAARRRIGFLPEHFRFYDWLSPAELLHLHGSLYGMPEAALRKRAPELLERVGLAQHRDKRLRDFSKGMMQRIGLAQALLNDPELIILDEPTSGLDPGGRRLVREIIKGERSRGATVFLNSHLLSEVEVTCDRVAFIKHGEVIEARRLDALRDGETAVRLRAGNLGPGALAGLSHRASCVEAAPAAPLPGTPESGQQIISFNVPSMEALPEILRYLVSIGADVYEVTPQRVSLEELFLRIVGEDGGL
ncbi:MAG: ATP-binding cassette domain-containing protein [Terriglobia bacterium]